MAQARIGSSQLLAIVLGATTLGAVLGFTFAPKSTGVSAAEKPAAVAIDPSQTAASSAQPTSSMQLDRSASTRDQAVAEQTSSPHVSSARIAEAKSKLEVRAAPAPAKGTGTINGVVLDEDRSPLEGVTLIAYSYGRDQISTTSSSLVGIGPPAEVSLDEALELAAKSWAQDRARRHVTTTAPDGSYAFADLPSDQFFIRGFKEDWSINPEDNGPVYPGETLNFKAAAVHSITLDVRLPGGTPPESAIIECEFNGDSLLLDWSPSKPTIRIGSKRFTITALGDPIVMPESNYDVASRLKSEPQDIAPEELPPGPLVMQLAGRPGIHGTITQEWPTSDTLNVAAVQIRDQASFNPDDIQGAARTTRVRGNEFVLLDLEPGLYAVGISSKGWGKPDSLRDTQFVQLGDQVAEVHLNVAAPTLSDHIKVTCLDAQGRPIDGVSFERKSRNSSGGGSSGGATSVQDSDGSYWFADEALADWNLGNWPSNSSIALTAKTPNLGSQILNLESGVREYTINFIEPTSLTVDIAGYADRDPTQKLSVRVVNPASKEPWDNTILHSDQGDGYEDAPHISKGGRVVFPAIAEGHWRVELTAGSSWDSPVLDSKDIKVASGDVSIRLALPQLFDLLMIAPKTKSGARVWLTKKRDDPSAPYQHLQATLHDDHRVTFKGLVAGNYTLTANGTSGSMEVTVPSGEVVFDPQLPNVMEVQINDQEGLLCQAGFRSGDKVTAVAGIPVDELDQGEGVFKDLTKGAVEMTVQRGGKQLSLTLGPIEEGASTSSVLGGELSFAFE